MPQPVAVEKDQPAGRDPGGSGHDGGATLARMQLVVEPAGGFVDHSQQQRVTAAGVVGRVVVPADMVTASRVEIEGVGVRIAGRRDLQGLTRQTFQPADQDRRAVQFRDRSGVLVDRVAADTATLLVGRQVVAVDEALDRLSGGDQAPRDFARQELRQMQKGALLHELAAQRRRVESLETGAHRLVRLESTGERRASVVRCRYAIRAGCGFDRQPTVEAGNLDCNPRSTRR